MQLPLLSPDIWVVFKQGAGYNMGKIIGASFIEGRGWLYDIIKVGLNAQFSVAENDIIYMYDGSLDDNKWVQSMSAK